MFTDRIKSVAVSYLAQLEEKQLYISTLMFRKLPAFCLELFAVSSTFSLPPTQNVSERLFATEWRRALGARRHVLIAGNSSANCKLISCY
jgi:hypothetical protein